MVCVTLVTGPVEASEHSAPSDHEAVAQDGVSGEDAHGNDPGGHGTTEDASSEGGEEEAYRLDGPLDGRYDIHLLRAGHRVRQYRKPLKEEIVNLGRSGLWKLVIGVTLEFGSESGMAEIKQREKRLVAQLRDVVHMQRPGDLPTVAGKLKLKRDLIEAFNEHFQTVRIRRIYFTKFQIVRG